MNTLSELLAQSSGPVIYPLLLCSVLGLAIIFERLWVFILYPRLQLARRLATFTQQPHRFIHHQEKIGLAAGMALLLEFRHQPKAQRDERLSLWLSIQRNYLQARVRWLTLIGSIAPLLGLLGTVLGIITMFGDVASVKGAVTPALLAGGMWPAMLTTAVGMCIAIPTLVASQVFAIWGDHLITKMTEVLNQCSMTLNEHSQIRVAQALAQVEQEEYAA